MTEEDVHNLWTQPRLEAYAEDMGVKFLVSDLGPDGTVTVEAV